MGQQIRIFQNASDEMELTSQLISRFELLSIPWNFNSPFPAPRPLNETQHSRSAIFFSSFSDEVIRNIQLCSGSNNIYMIFPNKNLVLDWSKTMKKDNAHYEGRFHLVLTDDSPLLASANLKTLFSFIKRWILANSPAITDEKIPGYVGRGLWKEIESGISTANWGNGSVIDLRPNPKFKT